MIHFTLHPIKRKSALESKSLSLRNRVIPMETQKQKYDMRVASQLLTMFLTLIITSCTVDLSENDHYQAQQSKGNAYQTLEREGKHSIFLKGIDLAGYKDIVNGYSILTVMAPDDDAFTTFLSNKGFNSIDELNASDPQYLKSLIGFHLMYYAFDWDKLVNFRPSEGDGASEAEKQVNAGYYYKHRTRSSDPIEQTRVRLTSNAVTDTLISIYHYERYLPVFSNELFETKGIDAAYNYQYFYPGTAWGNDKTARNGFFNVSNAQVTDADNMVTDNGYLYHVTEVLEPLNTIYDELKNNSEYSDFLSLYDSYSTYTEVDANTSSNLGYIVYTHTHGSLPPIACEWPTTSYQQMDVLEAEGYNLFVPTNDAINDFFNTYWKPGCGYTSLRDLDPLILQYFIYQSFAESYRPQFPEEIKNGTVLTYYGTQININPDEVSDRKICANGLLYGMNKMEAPAIFASVIGPSFSDSAYVYYLYVLNGSDVILSLASDQSNFVTLIPSNAQMRANDPPMRLYTTTSGKELQQYSSEAGDYVALGTSAMRDMVNMHTAANISELPTSGTRVVQTNMAYNYWYLHNGAITTNALFNEQLEPTYSGTPWVSFHEITNDGDTWSNGRSYSYDATAPFSATEGDGLSHILSVTNDRNYRYYLFAQLLQKAGLVTSGALGNSILPTTDTRFICFIPTNEAIKNAIDSIPGTSSLTVAEDYTLSGTINATNKSKLANYLRNYFITSSINTFSDYPYPGSTCSGEFYTTGTYKIEIIDDGSLSVHLVGSEKENIVNVSTLFFNLPFAYNDGCFHFIDGILL